MWRIEEQLEERWDKGIGRRRAFLCEKRSSWRAGTCNKNIIQEVWAEIFDTSQRVICGIIAEVRRSSRHPRKRIGRLRRKRKKQSPRPDGAGRRLPGTYLVKFNIPELWSGKHKTTALMVRPSRISGATSYSYPSELPGIITT